MPAKRVIPSISPLQLQLRQVGKKLQQETLDHQSQMKKVLVDQSQGNKRREFELTFLEDHSFCGV
jgi:hypothetical protein